MQFRFFFLSLFEAKSVLDIHAQQVAAKSKEHAVSELPKWQLYNSQFHTNSR